MLLDWVAVLLLCEIFQNTNFWKQVRTAFHTFIDIKDFACQQKSFSSKAVIHRFRDSVPVRKLCTCC